MQMPTPTLVDEILQLDLLTLRAHTQQAGDALDPATHRAALVRGLERSRCCVVRQAGRLVGYAMLHARDDGTWFVTGFGTHPQHRHARVMRDLLAQVAAVVHEHRITRLASHVYKTNAASLAFHRKLGFRVTRENEKAVEFTLDVDSDLRRLRSRGADGRDGTGRTTS